MLHLPTEGAWPRRGTAQGQDERPIPLVGAALIAWEHQLVHPGDLSRLNAAFFTANGIVSIVVFLGALLDRVL